MRQQRTWRVVFVLTLSVAALCLARAQERAVVDQVKGAALTAKVPVDPAITTGRFDNGLPYYIRVNKQPANRIELRLDGERRLDPGRRRPIGARAFRRAHGLQRDTMKNHISVGFPRMHKELGEKRAFLPNFIQMLTRFADVCLSEGYGSRLGYSFDDYRQGNPRVFRVEQNDAFQKDYVDYVAFTQ